MEDTKRFALLIDADNISGKYIETILEEINKEGIATIRRMYGDWTKENKKEWKEIALRFSITPMQQFENTKGKNSTDSAMIIDAMDILYGDKVDGFCICSSDSDFTRLAQRLREAGKRVIGMGEKASEPIAMVSACEVYKYLDLIYKTKDDAEEKLEEQTQKKSIRLSEEDMKIKSEIIAIIEDSDEEGFALSSAIGDILKRNHPEFDPRNYGCRKLKDLFAKLGFRMKYVDDSLKGALKVYTK